MSSLTCQWWKTYWATQTLWCCYSLLLDFTISLQEFSIGQWTTCNRFLMQAMELQLCILPSQHSLHLSLGSYLEGLSFLYMVAITLRDQEKFFWSLAGSALLSAFQSQSWTVSIHLEYWFSVFSFSEQVCFHPWLDSCLTVYLNIRELQQMHLPSWATTLVAGCQLPSSMVSSLNWLMIRRSLTKNRDHAFQWLSSFISSSLLLLSWP